MSPTSTVSSTSQSAKHENLPADVEICQQPGKKSTKYETELPELSLLGESTSSPVSIKGVSKLVREISEYQNGYLSLNLLERGVALCSIRQVDSRCCQHQRAIHAAQLHIVQDNTSNMIKSLDEEVFIIIPGCPRRVKK